MNPWRSREVSGILGGAGRCQDPLEEQGDARNPRKNPEILEVSESAEGVRNPRRFKEFVRNSELVRNPWRRQEPLKVSGTREIMRNPWISQGGTRNPLLSSKHLREVREVSGTSARGRNP